MYFNDDEDDELTPPPPAGVLFAPAIRKLLFRYGSMKEVYVEVDPFVFNAFRVRYVLVTGEERTIKVPRQLWIDEQYGEIMKLMTVHLGPLPS